MKSTKGKIMLRLLPLLLCFLALPGQAQTYPSKPVRFVVGFPAGSTIDVVSRVVLEDIRKSSGANIVVENRPGALGMIAMESVARSPADGYTLAPNSSATNSSGPQLAKKAYFDPIKDFTHIGGLFRFDLMLVVNPARGFKTVQELIAEARREPGKLNFGYGSATGQVVAAAFNRAAGIQAVGIAYKGQPLAINDLLGGQVQYVTSDIGAVHSLLRAGKLAGLGIAAKQRSAIFPNVPTFAEAGLADVELAGWVGMAGPAGLPADIVAWWSKNIGAALAKKEITDHFRNIGVEPDSQPVAAFNRFVGEQYEVWGRHIRAAGIEPE